MKNMKKKVNILDNETIMKINVKLEVDYAKIASELFESQMQGMFDSADKVELILGHNKRVIVSNIEELVKLAEEEFLNAKRQQDSKIVDAVDLQRRIDNL